MQIVRIMIVLLCLAVLLACGVDSAAPTQDPGLQQAEDSTAVPTA